MLRIMGGDSSEHKLALLCGFLGFVLNFLIVEFPPLTGALDFKLFDGTTTLRLSIIFAFSNLNTTLLLAYNALQSNLNSWTTYFITNTYAPKSNFFSANLKKCRSLKESLSPEAVALAIPQTAMNIGLSVFGAFIAAITLLPGFRLARCHSSLQTHTSRVYTQYAHRYLQSIIPNTCT